MRQIVFASVVLILTLAGYLYGYSAGNTQAVLAQSASQESSVFDSQDVWREVNAYRVSKGIAPMEVYPRLCDNLVARYNAIRQSHGHDGFQEFIDQQQARGILDSATYYEVFASGTSAHDTVEAWTGSMGHEIAITTHTKGCAYSLHGLSIILMTD